MKLPTVHVDQLGGSLWMVRPVGEHDICSADELDAAFGGVEEHGTDIVVDLSRTTFVDSTIVHVLLTHARLRDGTVVLVVPAAGQPRRLFDLLRLDQVLTCFDHLDDALRALGR